MYLFYQGALKTTLFKTLYNNEIVPQLVQPLQASQVNFPCSLVNAVCE